ncbi:MAG TPA: hypothetical protein VN901_15200 [Candidatus Acidoferrales bacterium]|nr:hypothetical protein [Candidatus Acidoferrales bacterium]
MLSVAIFSDKWIAVPRFTVLVFLNSVTKRNLAGSKKHGWPVAPRLTGPLGDRAERSSS